MERRKREWFKVRVSRVCFWVAMVENFRDVAYIEFGNNGFKIKGRKVRK